MHFPLLQHFSLFPGRNKAVFTSEFLLGNSPCLKSRQTLPLYCTVLNSSSPNPQVALIECLLIIALHTFRFCFCKSSRTERTSHVSWGDLQWGVFELCWVAAEYRVNSVTYNVTALRARPSAAPRLSDQFRGQKAVHPSGETMTVIRE